MLFSSGTLLLFKHSSSLIEGCVGVDRSFHFDRDMTNNTVINVSEEVKVKEGHTLSNKVDTIAAKIFSIPLAVTVHRDALDDPYVQGPRIVFTDIPFYSAEEELKDRNDVLNEMKEDIRIRKAKECVDYKPVYMYRNTAEDIRRDRSEFLHSRGDDGVVYASFYMHIRNIPRIEANFNGKILKRCAMINSDYDYVQAEFTNAAAQAYFTFKMSSAIHESRYYSTKK